MALSGRRPGRHEVLRVDGHLAPEHSTPAGRVAVETLGDGSRGIRHLARILRSHAADDRRGVVRHDAVQQHRGARRRNRQGVVALRRRGVQARSNPVVERLEASWNGILARQRQAASVLEQPASHVLARRRGRQTGAIVRERRRRLTDRRPGAHLGREARHAELSARRLPRSRDRRQPGAGSRSDVRSCWIRPGVQCAHGCARVGVLGDPAVGKGSRCRDLGERVVAQKRSCERLGADGARRRPRAALPADIHAEQRLLRRRSPRREPVRRIACVPRGGHRQDEMALSNGPSRSVGLRQSGPAQPRDDYGQWPAHRRRGAGDEARLHVCVRSRDGPASLADRRASGADRRQRPW